MPLHVTGVEWQYFLEIRKSILTYRNDSITAATFPQATNLWRSQRET